MCQLHQLITRFCADGFEHQFDDLVKPVLKTKCINWSPVLTNNRSLSQEVVFSEMFYCNITNSWNVIQVWWFCFWLANSHLINELGRLGRLVSTIVDHNLIMLWIYCIYIYFAKWGNNKICLPKLVVVVIFSTVLLQAVAGSHLWHNCDGSAG